MKLSDVPCCEDSIFIRLDTDKRIVVSPGITLDTRSYSRVEYNLKLVGLTGNLFFFF